MFNRKNYSSHKSPVKVLFFGALFIGLISLFSWIVMLLWNAILPDVTGVKPLNFWKAAGLLVLSKILFGGFWHRRGPWKKRRSRWKEQWMNMTPEERKEARSRWKEHCRHRDASRD